MSRFPSALAGYSRPAVDQHVRRADLLAAALRQERDAAVQAQADLLRERDGAVAERDRLLAEQADLRAQRDALIAERDAALSAQRAVLAERDAAVHRRDRAAVDAPTPPPAAAPVASAVLAAGPVTAPPLRPERTTRSGPSRARRRRGPMLVAGVVAGVAALSGVGVAVERGADDGSSDAPSASAPSRGGETQQQEQTTDRPTAGRPATSSRPATAPADTAPAATAPAPRPLPATVPARWTTYRSADRSYSVGVPPRWRAIGSNRFGSASGLSAMSVRSAPTPALPDDAALRQAERAFAAARPGYRRLTAERISYKGLPAVSWEYVYGQGASTQRASRLLLVHQGRAYELHVQSRAASWRHAAPLVDGFRRSFSPSGVSLR